MEFHGLRFFRLIRNYYSSLLSPLVQFDLFAAYIHPFRFSLPSSIEQMF